MIAAYRKQADYLVLAGVLVQFLGGISTAALMPRGLGWLAMGVVIVGWLLLIGACAAYARAKGYHWSLGAIGLLNLLGPILLAFLPDRHLERAKGFQVIRPEPREGQ